MTEHPDMHRLAYGDKEVILIGTAHVSKASAALVAEVIASEQPDTVCVELCESRLQSIRQASRWQEMDIIRVIREKKAFLLLSNLLLASFQRRIADRMDIRPGQEMIAALDAAEAAGAHICLADRDIRVTLARTWRTMGLWAKSKLLFQMLLSLGEIEELSAEDIEKMKQADMLDTILSEVGSALPQLHAILIDERDQYLAHKIRHAPGQRVVAVVGAGHVPGIKAHWGHPGDLAALETVPPPKTALKLLGWLLPLAIMCLFAYGFYRGGTSAGSDMIVWWFAANGLLAGIGALIALGHPLTVLSSVIAAPFTSLNPLVAAGWVSGLVEAFTRKPRVRDFESLQEDIRSVRGFWSNKVTRILLVVVFTNLGSSIGTLVAFPLLLRVLRGIA
jgi:pheromone shutdown-related protein TraB